MQHLAVYLCMQITMPCTLCINIPPAWYPPLLVTGTGDICGELLDGVHSQGMVDAKGSATVDTRDSEVYKLYNVRTMQARLFTI